MYISMKTWCLVICAVLTVLINQSSLCKVDGDSSSTKRDRNGRFLALPIITYSPETRLRLGAVAMYFFRFRNSRPGTQLSSVKMPVSYTLENQIKVRLSYDLFLPGNDHIFTGFTEWIDFPVFFYGIGSDTQQEDEEKYTTRAHIFDLNYFRRILEHGYFGMRYNRLNSNIVEKDPFGQLNEDGLIPGNDGGIASGLGIVARFDKRDNVLNATRGPFIETKLTTYQNWLGSDFEFTKLELDFRDYWLVFKKHIIAFQAVIEHNWGNPSFETMALLGGDKIMRGHYLGRFRDNALWASQVEYRVPLGRTEWIDSREKVPFWHRWGLVGFLGLGNVAPTFTNPKFQDIKETIGMGIRFLALPKERVNVRIDFGFGTQRPGFYFNIREAF